MKPSKSNNSKKRAKKKKQKPSASRAPPIEEANDEEKARRALDLDWLMSAFSSLSFDQIVSAYDDTGRDPFKAAGILGSQLVDPGDEEEPPPPPPSLTEVEEIEEEKEEEEGEEKKGARERRQKKVAASSGIIANVIGRGYAKPSSDCGKKAGNKKDRQYSIEEGEEFLCSMLGDNSELGMAVVKDVLCQCGYDVEKALDALLDISTCSLHSFVEGGGCNHSCTYSELSSEGSAYNDTESLQSTDSSDSAYHPSERENDIPQYVGYSCRSGMRCLANSEVRPPSGSRAINPDLQQKVLESLFKVPPNSINEPSSMNWKKAVQQVEAFGQGLEYRKRSVTEPLLNATHGKEDEYHVCRSVARKHWDSMRTCYQEAAVAYSSGHRAHAAHLSDTGRIHGNLARKADEKASRELFQARNKDIKNTVTIDLHGQHVKQGIGLLKLHLLLFTYIPSVQFLKVITGCGGDGTGKGKLKCSVTSLAKREGIEWCEENSGTLLLRLDGLKEYSFTEDDGKDDSDEN